MKDLATSQDVPTCHRFAAWVLILVTWLTEIFSIDAILLYSLAKLNMYQSRQISREEKYEPICKAENEFVSCLLSKYSHIYL